MNIRYSALALAALLSAISLSAQEPGPDAKADAAIPDAKVSDAKADAKANVAPKAKAKAATAPDAAALFQEGRDALFQGDSKRAVKLFEQAVAADKNGRKTVYRLNLARAYRYDGKSEDSEKLLRQILKESPDHVEAGQLLADIHHAQHRWKEILEILEPLL
ncbi:MAG: tetratricopeptide repeat protein, partial [Planctomycetales bacterium]